MPSGVRHVTIGVAAGGGSGVPGVPTIGAVSALSGQPTFGNGKVLVGGTATGADASSFRATASSGAYNDDALLPVAVTRLYGGVPQTFSIHGRNDAGNSAESAASATFTPTTTPDRPTIGSATGGDAQASVTFTAPSGSSPPANGGSIITGYVVNALIGGQPTGVRGFGASSPIVITGLTNGAAYTFNAQAINAVGEGLTSGQSNSVTPAFTGGALGINFVSSFTPSTLRNNFAGLVGFQFTVGVGSSLLCTHLARWVVAGNSGTHTVKIANSVGTDVASVSVNTSGAPTGAFLYVALTTPVVLNAGSIYYIGSQEASGGDQWYERGNVLTHSAAATVDGPAYNAGAWSLLDATSNDGYVPVSFRY